ncbi:MAG: 4'-phosphopantetheinyl transferase superfamily protein [Pseudomonadota bacterium]
MTSARRAPVELFFVETSHLAPADMEAFATPLDAAERARAARLPPLAQRDFVVAHGLARFALSRFRAQRPPPDWRFRQGPQGKPMPEDAGPLDFSLSHAEGLAVVAVSGCGAVGVDGEAVVAARASAQTAALLSGARELAAWTSLEGAARTALFFALWTLKESLLKAAGCGLAGDPRSICCALDPLRVVRHSLPARGQWMSWSMPLAGGFHIALSLDACALPHSLRAVPVRRPAELTAAGAAPADGLRLTPIPHRA